MILQAPEIQSIDQLIQILNSKDQITSEAHKPNSQISFEIELSSFWVFRETMLERTEEFLQNFIPSAPTMDGIRRKLTEAVNVSYGLCFSRSNLFTSESDRLTEEDAYKARYLVEYLYFLRQFSSLIEQYMEYAIGFGMKDNLSPDADGDLLIGANSHLDPEVKGIPVKTAATEAVEKNIRELKKEMNSDDKKAYRLSIIGMILNYEGGWEKFMEKLTNEGKAMLYAEIAESSLRYAQALLNREKGYPWKKYYDLAKMFLELLPRFKQ